MKKNNILLAAGLTVISVCIYLTLNNSTKQNRIEDTLMASPHSEKMNTSLVANTGLNADSLRKSLTSLEKKIEKLNAEVIAIRGIIQTQKVASNTSDNVEVHNQINETQDLADKHAEQEKYLQKQSEALETLFMQQTIDPDWSDKAKDLINAALANDKIPAKDIISIDCKNSMCRVELTIDSENPANISEFPMKIAEELPNMMVNHINDGGGSTTTVLYLSKNSLDFTFSGNSLNGSE